MHQATRLSGAKTGLGLPVLEMAAVLEARSKNTRRRVPEQAPGFVEELRRGLCELPGPEGGALNVQTLSAEQAYGPSPRGVPPDLTLLIEDLSFRVLGTLGHPGLMVSQNDRGHDGANHAQHGIVIAKSPGLPPGQRADLSLYDIAPTVLGHLQIPAPPHMQGAAIQSTSY